MAASQKIVVIIAGYSDQSGYPATVAQAQSTFTSSSSSVHSYFEATSRGRLSTTTTVLGPWNLGISQCPWSWNWSFGSSFTAAFAAAKAHGYNFSSVRPRRAVDEAAVRAGLGGRRRAARRTSRSTSTGRTGPATKPSLRWWLHTSWATIWACNTRTASPASTARATRSSSSAAARARSTSTSTRRWGWRERPTMPCSTPTASIPWAGWPPANPRP